ncbi:hypothetical protein WCE39_11655 [Luteimonas sp. MJ174]|uniref:hypothetical protein n=1 Tax=Luteimonas sp. MJ174 TaxID=3129237 RepID=UPI0031BA675A
MASRFPLVQVLAPLLLIPATWLVWQLSLTGGFIFDDLPNLVRASGWQANSLAPSELWAAMGSGLTSDAGRPLAMLSFAVNHALTGLDPWWLKATSLVMHAVNAVLVAVLVRQLFAHTAPSLGSPSVLTVAAWLTALAWAAHPIHASTVAYAVQRMEIGAAMGMLLSLLAYMQFRHRLLAGRRAWPYLLLATLAWAAGLGFKESAAVAPVLALLIEWLCFRFRARGGSTDYRIVAAFFFGALAAAMTFVLVVVPLTSQAAYAPRTFDALERTSTQFPVLSHYLALILWPAPDTFRFYYDNFPVSLTPWHDARTTMATFAILALVGSSWSARRRWPLLAFGIAWFFACHAITSSPIPLELAFEHRNYLATLGPLLILANAVAILTKRLHGDARMAIGAALVLTLAILGVLQAATWGEQGRLALTLENRAPTSARAAYGFATHMFNISGGDRTSPAWSLGMETLRRATDLPSASPLIPQAIIVLSARGGEPLPEGTWPHFRKLLLQRPIGPEGIESLYAVVQCRIANLCRYNDAELLSTVLEVVRANPGNATVRTMYANVAWNVLDDRELAIRMQREALSLSGGGAPAALGLAEFLLASGDSENSEEGQRILESLRRQPSGNRKNAQAITALECQYEFAGQTVRCSPAPEQPLRSTSKNQTP